MHSFKSILILSSYSFSPNNTFFHMQIKKNKTIVLFDWPKMRIMSQKWTRSGGMNPSMKVITFEEFNSGELKEEVKIVFGDECLAKMILIVSEFQS